MKTLKIVIICFMVIFIAGYIVAIALEDMKGHVEDYFGDDAMVKHMYELKQAGVTLKVYLKKLIYPIGVLCIVYLILFLKRGFKSRSAI